MKKFALALLAAGAISLGVAPPADAYPPCYYSYGGCYLPPGWYAGRYWWGGPWWGWGSLTERIHSQLPGCPIPYGPDGTCAGR